MMDFCGRAPGLDATDIPTVSDAPLWHRLASPGAKAMTTILSTGPSTDIVDVIRDAPALSPEAAAFDQIYRDAAGDARRIAWADERPSSALVNWLNAVAPGLLRCGSRVAVVGCGLGDDVRALIDRGYDVVGFDCSPTAIDWARRRDPDNADSYIIADLFDLPERWRHRFDLVVEINTIQSLPIDQREQAMAAISEMVSSHGHLLVICRGCEQPAADGDGPPWPLTERDLLAITRAGGMVCDGEPCSFMDDETPPIRRTRAVFRRA